MFALPPLCRFGRHCKGESQRPDSACAAFGALAIAMLAGVLATPATSSAASARTPRSCSSSSAPTYTVVDGDTWYGIARLVDVNIDSLFKANGATETSPIYPGDVLCVPADATTMTSTSSPTQAARSCSPSDAVTYTVVAGDSWFSIARLVDLKIGSLFKANGATESSAIHPGDVLCLPDGKAPSVSSSSAAVPKGVVGARAFPAQGPCLYVDSWRAPRGNGRRHEGVDLIAKPGQFVYAVADGTLTRRAWDQPGLLAGNAWWLTSADGSGTYYFYAHLSGFAPGLKVGSTVSAGQIIGFVGKSGNTALAHLHFEIHPNGGDAINPYPMIKSMGGCKTSTPYEQPGGWTPTAGGG